ncbi:MAG TPA: 16S rRNA (uracil(1498)-N(3))-methyltransferase [Oscillospiraceae bacterium]|nr:16S rRNA (uracil(1498)-N(3))-methyltransferase [Oscillospiraceae bacterium]
MNRFFYQTTQREAEIVRLQGDDAHHLRRVLRAAVGEQIELCDEQGLCHLARVTQITKDEVECALASALPSSEPQTKIELAFGLLKGEKTELVLQKATELGVSSLRPFFSERTVVRADKKQGARYERWQKIVRAAAAQARRAQIPAVVLPCQWSSLLTKFVDYDQVILFWEAELEQPLAQALRHCARGARILLLTGPEGGFSEVEVRGATAAGAEIVTLGPRILRAETAAITAVALTMYQAGEMRR